MSRRARSLENLHYTPTKYIVRQSRQYLRPAYPFCVCLDADRMSRMIEDSLLDNMLISEFHYDKDMFLKTERYQSILSELTREIENNFILGASSSYNTERLYVQLYQLIALVEYCNVEEIQDDRVSDILDSIMDELSEQFSIYPVNYEPTGYEYFEIRRRGYVLEVRCIGDKRIMVYHGELRDEREDNRNAPRDYRRPVVISTPWDDLPEADIQS